ncbi:MAG: baseplate J/gp47 family protein [Lachnospiraceae bacterium]|nr:baseplate J/gp47 family protein [Lachnospiraceae bacterium]
MIAQISNLPDVSFIDNLTLDDVQALLTSSYEERYEQVTKQKISLKRADPATLTLYACSVLIYQALMYVDRAGKQDLIKYSYGEFLDNIAANKGVTRLPAQAAEVIVRFKIPAPREDAVGIPAGTRVTNGDSIYFGTMEYAEIPPGDVQVDIPCRCQTAGATGSGLAVGSINTLVDLLPYISGVSNIEESQGGADIEDDESLAERVYLAPARYSVAGPRDAYIYHTKAYGASIGSVNISSPKPCEVEVRVLLKDGSLPSQALLDGILDYLDDDTIRPLTDNVKVLAPYTREYDLDVTYYISKVNAARAISIQTAVSAAVDAYNTWQTGEIGRDINPSELIRRMVEAGAKRVVVDSPSFVSLPASTVARLGNMSVTYGGIEDD